MNHSRDTTGYLFQIYFKQKQIHEIIGSIPS